MLTFYDMIWKVTPNKLYLFAPYHARANFTPLLINYELYTTISNYMYSMTNIVMLVFSSLLRSEL